MSKNEYTVMFDQMISVWARQTVTVESENEMTNDEIISKAELILQVDGPDNYEYISDSERIIEPNSLVKYKGATSEILIGAETVFDNSKVEKEPTEEEISAAKELLERAGFAVRYLWHIDDVYNKDGSPNRQTLEKDDALMILNDAVYSDYIMEQTNNEIESELGNFLSENE